ncbi:WcbI family polysaccharide biosynthesis putative acetyltransferase [Pseudoroseomonas cervicalis]|uniref:Polysaccharide biosynthesis enzyme WcbI domain-containing protein n=1 Tax=Pseudoroseomonas cervicalis ATCC 49957 TaxID=525371 RepID=D5RHB5_9PROT|nr:WcbI family polysaccharide biosynthesis putative acetyltransferase [Pseudoroseomonas cervicalis]EFH13301.1 hypothetical protein HMPREF0731_0474 [Pseudoroseomonas cervicalis ATCC 49957]
MQVYIHGNCQSTALRLLLGEAGHGLEIASREVQTAAMLEEIGTYECQIRAADAVVAQVVSKGYRGETRLSTAWIRQAVRPDARLVVYNGQLFDGYFPQLGYLPELRACRMDYHDWHLAELYARGASAEDAVGETGREDFFSAGFAEAHAEASLREAEAREARTLSPPLRLAPVLRAEFRRTCLFHTVNHPSRFLLLEMGRQILAALGLPDTLPTEGPEHLGTTRILPYPALRRHLGLAFGPEARQITVQNRTLPLLDYVGELFETYARQGGPARVAEALRAAPRAMAYLEAYHREHGGVLAA